MHVKLFCIPSHLSEKIMDHMLSAIRHLIIVACICLSFAVFIDKADAQSRNQPDLAWIHAPSKGEIAGKAHINLTGNLVFLNADDTRKFLVLSGNLPTDNANT